MVEQLIIGDRVCYTSARIEGTVVAIDGYRIKVAFAKHGEVWVLRRNISKLPPANKAPDPHPVGP